MVPTNPLKLIAFFEQCQAINKAAGVLENIAKDKNQPKEKKMAHLRLLKVLAVGQTSGSDGWVKKLALIIMKGKSIVD